MRTPWWQRGCVGVGLTVTPAQLDVLQGVVDGLSSKEIGVRLGITEKTVNCHRSALCRRLEARNTADLVREALVRGLVRVPDATVVPQRRDEVEASSWPCLCPFCWLGW
jgi:DNA-binding CsgD family transcriptional regulator